MPYTVYKDGVPRQTTPIEDAEINADKAQALFDRQAELNAVPKKVTILQFRRALKVNNALALFRGYVLAPTTGEDDQEYWQFTDIVRRDALEVSRARVGLGFTERQVDNLFKQAITL